MVEILTKTHVLKEHPLQHYIIRISVCVCNLAEREVNWIGTYFLLSLTYSGISRFGFYHYILGWFVGCMSKMKLNM